MKEPPRRQRRSAYALLIALLVACMSIVSASSPAHAEDPVFTDVPVDHPYYKEIAWMKSSGISTGWDDGTYRPSEQVDRDAMAAFFYRYLESPPSPRRRSHPSRTSRRRRSSTRRWPG